MGVPTVPLTDLYNRAGDYIRARGGVLHFRQPVEGFSRTRLPFNCACVTKKRIQPPRVPHPCRVLCDRVGILTLR